MTKGKMMPWSQSGRACSPPAIVKLSRDVADRLPIGATHEVPAAMLHVGGQLLRQPQEPNRHDHLHSGREFRKPEGIYASPDARPPNGRRRPWGRSPPPYYTALARKLHNLPATGWHEVCNNSLRKLPLT